MKQEVKLGFEIRTLDNMLRRNFISSVKESGLDEVTVMHGWIIGYLYNNREKAIYQRDIESHFSIGRSTVTNILKLMEKKGCLVRESVSSDARLKRLKLTEKGIRLHEDTKRLLDRLDAKTIEGIEQEELSSFYATIAKLKKNLEKQRMGKGCVSVSCICQEEEDREE